MMCQSMIQSSINNIHPNLKLGRYKIYDLSIKRVKPTDYLVIRPKFYAINFHFIKVEATETKFGRITRIVFSISKCPFL